MTFRTTLKRLIEYFLIEWELDSIVKEDDFVVGKDLQVGGVYKVKYSRKEYSAKILSRGK